MPGAKHRLGIRQCVGQALRRLVEHEGSRHTRELAKAGPPRSGADGQESLEVEAVGGESGDGQRGNRGTRPGDGTRGQPFGTQRGEQAIPGVTDQRRPRVTDERHAVARLQAGNDLGNPRRLIVLVQ